MRQRGIVCVNQLKSVSQTSFIQRPEFPDVVGVRLPRPRLVFALLVLIKEFYELLPLQGTKHN